MVNFTVNFTKYQIYNSIWSKFFQNLIEVKQTCFKLQPQMQSEARFKKHTPDCWLSQETTASSSSSVFSAERWDSNTFLNFYKIQRKNKGNFWGKQNFSITHTFIINVQIQLTQWNWYGELALSICVCILKLTILHLWGCSWGHANFILIRFSENVGKISN